VSFTPEDLSSLDFLADDLPDIVDMPNSDFNPQLQHTTEVISVYLTSNVIFWYYCNFTE